MKDVTWKMREPISFKGLFNACGHPDCSMSSDLDEVVTFGRGVLDMAGHWSEPCATCARAFEKQSPQFGPCWPPEES